MTHIDATDQSSSPQKANTIRDHLIDVVSQATLCREPFCHFYVESLFPKNVYPQVLKNLPAVKYYEPQNIKKWVRPDGTSTRDNFFLTPENLAKLPPEISAFWNEIVDAVLDDTFKRAILSKLSPDIAARFDVPVSEVPNIPSVPELILIRDIEDYQIKPHPDGLNKIITLQMYLPEDDKSVDLGTSLYKHHKSMFSSRFEEVKRFPFLPNSAYAFAVSDSKALRSWHGREMISSFKGVRNTMMVNFQLSARYKYGN